MVSALSCDDRLAPLKREITAALDQRAEAIRAFAADHAPIEDLRYRRVILGPTYVREPAQPFSMHEGWREYAVSWADIETDYQNIKNQPVNQGWVSLNSAVRSILSDDLSRLAPGSNYFLDRASGPEIQAALEAVRAAINSAGAIEPASALAFIRGNPVYLALLRTGDLARLRRQLRADVTNYRFTRNVAITRPDDRTLVLPLEAGPFEGFESQLGQYIKSIWRSQGLELDIRWARPPADGAFAFILGASPDRAYVSYREKAVHLFPNVRTRSIAHEIGHVLGFLDHYYTRWSVDRCEYIIQTRDDDLMADSDRGIVTSEEWADLNTQYPTRGSR